MAIDSVLAQRQFQEFTASLRQRNVGGVRIGVYGFGDCRWQAELDSHP
jgi:hypothetical protein